MMAMCSCHPVFVACRAFGIVDCQLDLEYGRPPDRESNASKGDGLCVLHRAKNVTSVARAAGLWSAISCRPIRGREWLV